MEQADLPLPRQGDRARHPQDSRAWVLANDCAPGATEPVEDLTTEWMEVKIRDVLEPWMATATTAYRENILRLQQAKGHGLKRGAAQPGKHLIDGFESRRWLAVEDDQAPTVTFA